MTLSGKIMDKMASKSKAFTDALKANACEKQSPSKQWRCILPKGHQGPCRAVVLAIWEKNKEILEPYA